jgi:hypothetical protein
MPALYSPSTGAAATPAAETLLEVSYPGSMAPHYRVQALSSETSPQWKLVASFSDQKLAQICLDRLRKQGQVVRLIAYRRVPTAA